MFKNFTDKGSTFYFHNIVLKFKFETIKFY